MKQPEIKETHLRSCRVVLEKRDLERLVLGHALQAVGFPDATEGSPAYKVGNYCVVDLAEDQTKIARVSEN